jgi:hypothetical protein
VKLAAIYNVWDGDEHLKGSMECLKAHVDLFVIVYQHVSNFGEYYMPNFRQYSTEVETNYIKYDPKIGHGSLNEKAKRNKGIDYARDRGCTHFLTIDCDEYYEDFGACKKLYIDSGYEGSVCKMYTYFKRPTLRFENPDNYYVPFIHKLDKWIESGQPGYPFYVDPTRRINTDDVIELPIFMHHFSWVRNDIERKIRNSTAKKNIERSQLLQDYHSDVKAGSFIVDYGQHLIEVENIFKI